MKRKNKIFTMLGFKAKPESNPVPIMVVDKSTVAKPKKAKTKAVKNER